MPTPLNHQTVLMALETWKTQVLQQNMDSTEDEADLFLTNFIHPESVHLHPKKPNLLMWERGEYWEEVKVHHTNYRKLIGFYQMEPAMINLLLEARDQLLDFLKRRYQKIPLTPQK